MTKASDLTRIKQLLTRGVSAVYGDAALKKKLTSGKKIRIYLGIDPTSAEIHLGHAIILRRLRDFQELGHEIILLVGDFTARIGDPTDKDAARIPLSAQEVAENAESYKAQASKILDFTGKNAAKLLFNSKWLEKLSFADVTTLAANFTAQQMLERDMFQERIKAGKPIGLHEFLYPLMQAYDSVAMEVDMEVGGTDQTFNMLAGRTLMRRLKDKEKYVMTIELLEGTDGRKMSKSFSNIIPVTASAFEMCGAVMSLRDELIIRYFELATAIDEKQIREYEKQLQRGANPRDIKMALAKEIVTYYHSDKAAEKAEAEFKNVFKEKKKPTKVEKFFAFEEEPKLVDLLEQAGLAESRTKARKLIEQGAITVDGEKITDIEAVVGIPEQGLDMQIGKRRFLKIIRPT